jgi:uncharacterized coiled-coil protein SlyX
MLNNEELARAYNLLDMLVQPEGDESLEGLIAHICELQQELERLRSIVATLCQRHGESETDYLKEGKHDTGE